jgi:hypothetical protein
VPERLHEDITADYADEAPGWDALHARLNTKRINHSVAFSDDGACTNQAESYFARLRRAEGAGTTGTARSSAELCFTTQRPRRGVC